jgi:hypothetical protein
MSLLDSEDVIAHEVEMASDITHNYLVDVMKYSWKYDPTWNMDVYWIEFLGGAYVKIRRYRKTEKDQDVEPIWFTMYSTLGLRERSTVVHKVNDIYSIYKEIRESYLKLGRGEFYQ